MGNPFGLGHTVSRGHIAGLDRALKLGSHQLGGLIQVQAPLYPGDSGAVVANLDGQLLGLIRSGLAIPATAKDRAERDNDFGFALAVRDILWVTDQLRAFGHVDRAYLGVRLEPVSAAAASRPKVEADSHPARDVDALLEGALIIEVMAGTPAARAGLRAGDAVVAVNGQPVRSPHDLTDRLDRLPAESMIHVDVVRGRGPQRQQMRLELRTSSRTEAGMQAALSPTSGSPVIVQPGPVTASTGPGSSLPPAASSSPTDPTAGALATSSDAAAASPPHTGDRLGFPDWPGRVATLAGNTGGGFDPRGMHSPLRAAVPPPQAEELKLTLPRAVTDRLELLEAQA